MRQLARARATVGMGGWQKTGKWQVWDIDASVYGLRLGGENGPQGGGGGGHTSWRLGTKQRQFAGIFKKISIWLNVG